MSRQPKSTHRNFILLNIGIILLLITLLITPTSALAAVNLAEVPSAHLLKQEEAATDTNPFRLQSVPVAQTGTVWQINQIVGLPKGTVIYQGFGFDWPVNACAPEEGWLVKVIGGPHTAEGYTWYDGRFAQGS
jgi:hypothetical protein